MTEPAREAPTGPRATVVIVNWNGAHLLPACLDAVRAQELPSGSFETWVVDNGSRDGSADLLRRDYPWVRVIRNRRNLGFAGGNDVALREVRTPYAVLLNNDAVPDPHWLRHLLAAFDRPGSERLGAVTPRILFLPRYLRLRLSTPGFRPGSHDPRELGVRVHRVTVDGEPVDPLWERLTWGAEDGYSWTRPAGELLLPVPDGGPHVLSFTWGAERDKDVELSWHDGAVVLPVTAGGNVVETKVQGPLVDVLNNAGGVVLRTGHGADRGFQEIDAGQYGRAEEVFSFCGNGVALRREALEDVGLFDESFFVYYEDTDLSWRMRSAGWSIRYEPAAVLRHHHAASTGEWSPLFTFHVDRNRLLMLTKNASTGLVVREVLRYPLSTASMAVRATLAGVADLRPPAVRPTWLRLRVLASYLRLLPAMLARRRRIERAAVVDRAELETWLVGR